jgi:hypothetical protein
VSPVKYELGFYSYIPVDDILHSDHREHLTSYKTIYRSLIIMTTLNVHGVCTEQNCDLRKPHKDSGGDGHYGNVTCELSAASQSTSVCAVWEAENSVCSLAVLQRTETEVILV